MTKYEEKLLKINEENFYDNALVFRDRQAGVSLIYDGENDSYSYNAYCLETKIMKELFTKEFSFLQEALDFINDEFGNWDLVSLSTKKSGCGSCAAKK